MTLNTDLLKRTVRGWLRSWTANAATIIAVLGVIQANIAVLNLTPSQQGYALIVIGALMAILRAKTAKPIVER